MTFHDDLIVGKSGENFVRRYIEQAHPELQPTIIDGYCKEGDILLSNGKLVEVKVDLRSSLTDSLIVEASFNGSPSGLKATGSYRWVFYCGDIMIITTPWRLWDLCKKCQLQTVKFGARECLREVYFLLREEVITGAIKVIKLAEGGDM